MPQTVIIANCRSMQTIDAVVQNLVREFSEYPDWESRYKAIIQMGQKLPPMNESHKNEQNKVKGCQSQVWLFASAENGKVIFEGDSDAAIVKGLVALVLKVYSQRTPTEILNTPPDFIEKLGLNANLSQTRANGLAAMVKQIKYYALAFNAVLGK